VSTGRGMENLGSAEVRSGVPCVGAGRGGGCGRNGRCRFGLVAGQLAVPDAFVLSSVDLGLEMVGPQRERASVLRLHAFAFSFSLATREGGEQGCMRSPCPSWLPWLLGSSPDHPCTGDLPLVHVNYVVVEILKLALSFRASLVWKLKSSSRLE
jgi:hypothetical protein